MKQLPDLYGSAYVKAFNKVREILMSVFPTLEKVDLNACKIEALTDAFGITFDDDGNIIR